jgi:hypothetical protein
MKSSRRRPSWRLNHSLNRQEVTCGEPAFPRDVKNEDRSDYVYENDRQHDKMPDDFAGIYTQLKLILHKIADFERPLTLICRFGTCFWRNSGSPRAFVCDSAACRIALIGESK